MNLIRSDHYSALTTLSAGDFHRCTMLFCALEGPPLRDFWTETYQHLTSTPRTTVSEQHFTGLHSEEI